MPQERLTADGWVRHLLSSIDTIQRVRNIVIPF